MNANISKKSARPFGVAFFQPIEGESLRVASGVQAGLIVKTHITMGPKGNVID